MKKVPLIKIYKEEKYYLKLTRSQKLQHYVLMITFLLLVFTGFPLKFYYYTWAKPVILFFGGLEIARKIHHLAGVTMIVLFFYHWYYLFQSIARQYIIPALKTDSFKSKELVYFIYYSPMFPRLKDLKDIFDYIKYVMFFTDQRPKHERFHWKEKLDYWAVFWGIPVLGITGLISWFPVWSTSFLPVWAVNVSYIAHSDEAMLAVSVIFIWHMYNAHVNYDKFPMSPLFITGYLPEKLMRQEYLVEWARINKLVRLDPTLMVDLDARKAARELSDEQKLGIIRERIAFFKTEDPTSLKNTDQDGLVDSKTYHHLALELANSGHYDAAFEAFEKAGGRHRAYNNLGCFFMKKGAFEKAVAYFEKAIAENPTNYATAHKNLKKAKAAMQG